MGTLALSSFTFCIYVSAARKKKVSLNARRVQRSSTLPLPGQRESKERRPQGSAARSPGTQTGPQSWRRGPSAESALPAPPHLFLLLKTEGLPWRFFHRAGERTGRAAVAGPGAADSRTPVGPGTASTPGRNGAPGAPAARDQRAPARPQPGQWSPALGRARAAGTAERRAGPPRGGGAGDETRGSLGAEVQRSPEVPASPAD